MLGVSAQEVWHAVLDTARPDADALEVKSVYRAGVVQDTVVTSAPFTGVQVTGSVLSPNGHELTVLRDGMIMDTLTPDARRRATFTILLPRRADPYIISFMVDQQPEELLFIDTAKPLQEAFRCRLK